ncbi:MAG TPA: L,D-transpeptidase [Gemmatimonadaceae bacterium]|nr:L,D-transpeptidase [Gemmatimonadaceae bacterium]
MRKLSEVLKDAPPTIWVLAVATVIAGAVTAGMLYDTVELRRRRDGNEFVVTGVKGQLDSLRRHEDFVIDSLQNAIASSPETPLTGMYIVVSIEDRRLWLKEGDTTLYTTRVAVGSGKSLVQTTGGKKEYKFDTPRGRLTVQYKEVDPYWMPPDWHFVEMASKKKGMGVVMLKKGQKIDIGDGSWYEVRGEEVVRAFPDGHVQLLEASEGHELVAGNKIVVPPFGTTQRKYKWVVGGHRLNLGDGYGLHGTDEPKSIGQAASHGCVRLRNEDIAYLYSIVPVGTPVYIY